MMAIRLQVAATLRRAREKHVKDAPANGAGRL